MINKIEDKNKELDKAFGELDVENKELEDNKKKLLKFVDDYEKEKRKNKII